MAELGYYSEFERSKIMKEEKQICVNCGAELTDDQELETGFCLECYDDILNDLF